MPPIEELHEIAVKSQEQLTWKAFPIMLFNHPMRAATMQPLLFNAERISAPLAGIFNGENFYKNLLTEVEVS